MLTVGKLDLPVVAGDFHQIEAFLVKPGDGIRVLAGNGDMLDLGHRGTSEFLLSGHYRGYAINCEGLGWPIGELLMAPRLQEGLNNILCLFRGEG